ncbi:MAG: potassium transporter Kup [Betaproteobacteria bacterium]
MHNKKRTAGLALAALGVVYGDIGTSPLYSMKEVFAGAHHPLPVTPENVLGILSLMFWSLIMVVSVKYVTFILRADNKGEGGIMALMAMALPQSESDSRRRKALVLAALFGAALFYGDGVITPAISVLSAVEGLEVATPAFKPYVLPISLIVLAALFLVQRRGTASVGFAFGPVMVVWFAVLGLLGIGNIMRYPEVLAALDPLQAARFAIADPLPAFFSLGGVVLVVTGTEALYADMGHFGRTPVRLAWFSLVLPALALNYFGQGALLLHDPKSIENPFYLAAPQWALLPLVGLATAATVIASQAVISGAYSMTVQAMHLGYAPRMDVQYTSEKEMGQIYVPFINWTLLLAVAALILGFHDSSALAAAYGIAVTGTMGITTVLAYLVARRDWGWPPVVCVVLFGIFLLIDGAFFLANAIKIEDGGWFPLAMGAFVFVLLSTWKRGRALLAARMAGEHLGLKPFLESLTYGMPALVPGTAIYLNNDPDAVPHALLHSLKHYKVLHERQVLVSVQFFDVPYVPDIDRVEVRTLACNFHQVIVQYGFKDEPDLPAAIAACARHGLDINPPETTYFLGRETLIPRLKSDMAFWREKLFVAMFRNAGSATAYFKIPSNRVVELGTQVVL